jgi:hypothetical protein
MNIRSLVFIPFLITLLSANAQSASEIEAFKFEVDSYLSTLPLDSLVRDYRVSATSRKVKSKHTSSNRSIKYKQKVKYLKSGLKKEIVIVSFKLPQKQVSYLKVIKINDELFYVRRKTYKDNELAKPAIEEKLIDNNTLYRFDYSKKKISVIRE